MSTCNEGLHYCPNCDNSIDVSALRSELQAACLLNEVREVNVKHLRERLYEKNAIIRERDEQLQAAQRVAREALEQLSVVIIGKAEVEQELQAARQRIEEVWLERDEAKRVRDERIAELEQQNDDYTEQLAKNGERLMKLLEPTTAAGRESEGGE